MTMSEVWHRYWRIPVVAVLAAVLAFTSSYLVESSYESSTRLIIHGRDAGFLSSTGQDSAQPTLIDATQAKALADTYGSIATSRSLAVTVVDRLHLDAPSTDHGFIHGVSAVAATVYRCSRAFVTSGFCASVNRREKAIDNVSKGTTALQLGTTAGDTAGQPGSYVLEVTSTGNSPKQAQSIADGVADALVDASTQQVALAANAFLARVGTQIDAARDELSTRTQAVTDFENAHNISAADQQLVATATSYDQLAAQLSTAQADLVDARGKLTAIQQSLATTAPNASSDQKIDTGRSSTDVTTTNSNPVYQDLLTEQSQQQAAISGLQARITELQSQLAAGSPSRLNGELADLENLQLDLTSAQDNLTTLTTTLQTARTQAATAAPDLTRLDTAGAPSYPTSPRRYLYLLIGLVVGLLAGSGLTWLACRRVPRDEDRPRVEPAPVDPAADGGASNGRGSDDDLVGDLFPAYRGALKPGPLDRRRRRERASTSDGVADVRDDVNSTDRDDDLDPLLEPVFATLVHEPADIARRHRNGRASNGHGPNDGASNGRTSDGARDVSDTRDGEGGGGENRRGAP